VFGRRKRSTPRHGITLIPWTDDPDAERVASWRVETTDGRVALDFGWRAHTDTALNALRNEILSWPDD